VELITPPVTLELSCDRIDPLGDNENWTLTRFREKVAKRPIETPREHDALVFLRHE
jgi:hypothetical protein